MPRCSTQGNVNVYTRVTRITRIWNSTCTILTRHIRVIPSMHPCLTRQVYVSLPMYRHSLLQTHCLTQIVHAERARFNGKDDVCVCEVQRKTGNRDKYFLKWWIPSPSPQLQSSPPISSQAAELCFGLIFSLLRHIPMAHQPWHLEEGKAFCWNARMSWSIEAIWIEDFKSFGKSFHELRHGNPSEQGTVVV